MLRLITFGGLSIQDSSVGQRSRLAVLAVVAAAGSSGISRDNLLALFWPESTTDRARAALRQALFALRRDLQCDDLTSGASELRLNPEVISADVTDFESAIGAGDPHRAAALYSGPFLDGVHLRGSPEFERWLDVERAKRRAQVAAVLEQLAIAEEGAGRADRAVAYWRRLSSSEPLSDRVAVKLMRALVATGDRGMALSHASAFERLMREQLETPVDPAFRAFVDLMRASPDNGTAVGHLQGQTGAPGTPAIAAPAPVAHDMVAVTRAARTPTSATTRRAAAIGISLASVVLLTVLARRMKDAESAEAISVPSSVDRRTELGRVLVLPIDNATNDTSLLPFGRLAGDWIADGLAQTGLVDVVDGQTLALILNPDAEQHRRPTAHDITGMAAASGARTLVVGRMSLEAGSLVVRVRVVDGATGRVLRVVPASAAPANAPRRLLEDLRRKVGGSIASLADPRVAMLVDVSAQPPTIAAYRQYVDGLSHFARNDFESAAPSFVAAARADSMFSLPLVWLAFTYANTGQRVWRDSVVDVLARRQERLAPLDRYALGFFLAHRSSDIAAQYENAVRASRLAPQSTWMMTRAQLATQLGRYREALAALRSLDPDHGWLRRWPLYFYQLTRNLHFLGDHGAELDAALDGATRDRSSAMYLAMRVTALAALGRAAELRRIADSTDAPASMDRASVNRHRLAGLELLRHGHTSAAREFLDRCIRWYDRLPADSSRTVQDESRRAECLYADSRWDSARAAYRRVAAVTSADAETRAIALHRLGVLTLRDGDSVNAVSYERQYMAVFPWGEAAPKVASLDEIAAALRGDRSEAVALLQASWKSKLPESFQWHTDVDLRRLWTYRPFVRWQASRD